MKTGTLSLAHRFRFAFGIIGVAFIMIGIVSAVSAERMMASGRDLYIGSFGGIQKTDDLDLLFERARANVVAIPAEIDLQKQRASQNQLHALLKEFRDRLDRYTEFRAAAHPPSVAQIKTDLDAFQHNADAVYAQASNFVQDKATEIVAGPFAVSVNGVQAGIKTLRDFEKADARRRIDALTDARTGLLKGEWSIAIGMIAIVASWWMVATLVRRLTSLTRSMREIALGDTSNEVLRVDTRDEVGEMSRAVLVFKENTAALAEERINILATNVKLAESKEQAEAATEAAEAGLRANERITRELHEAQSELVTAARQAGMAEIANNVLHNVGNVLNSVNVSAGLVNSKMRDSKAQGLARAVRLMNEHEADLGEFLTRDERGKLLPGYLNKLVAALTIEQQNIVDELGSLTKSVDHITEIVATQQSYAGATSVVEAVQVRDLLEDALRINSAALTRHQVTVVKEFADQPLLRLDKSRVLQILVNLIANALQAMDGVIDQLHRMTLRMDVANLVDGRRLRISVEDDGEGIAPENMARLFVHGFTTHNKGHGFGLHSCALAAKEMGGTLTAQSVGRGKGAAFTLELPVNRVGDHP
jgi:C4-dicarboxylate-specific signal transduction histidine kinase